MRYLVELSRILVGVTFVFSGFTKAIDPLGFAYKIEDYLIELQMSGFFSLALPIGIFMVIAEFSLGVALLAGIYRRWTVRLIGLFMFFFTPLTLWIAIANPVDDCGCFGDALVISNWHTFYKNVVLLVATLLLLFKWRDITPLYSKKATLAVTFFTVLFGLLFSLYNVFRLPIMDFRPYHIGANISEQMYVDPDNSDIVESVFIYSKDGVEREFTEEDYPWDDSTWTYVDIVTRVVKEGESPKIEDFAIHSIYYDDIDALWHVGGDITDIILSDASYQFLMISPTLNDMGRGSLDKLREINKFANQNDYPFYLVTSSSAVEIADWEERYNTGFQFAEADERVLKTMIRSNPGLILMKEGIVVDKWDGIGIPKPECMGDLLDESWPVDESRKAKEETRRLVVVLLLFIVPLLLLKGWDVRNKRNNVSRVSSYE